MTAVVRPMSEKSVDIFNNQTCFETVMSIFVDSSEPASLAYVTYCGLVTPYGDTDLGQHRLR